MGKRVALFIYYLLIANLPGSRYAKIFNAIRIWYVSKVLKIMKYDCDSFFENGVYISNGENIHIGNYCQINENVFIQAATIGDYVMIAPNVAILSKSHKIDRVDVPMVKQGETESNPPIIEDDVWIGRNAIVLPGLVIGRGSVVAAGAIVCKSVEPFSIVGGIPAKLIKKRITNSEENSVT